MKPSAPPKRYKPPRKRREGTRKDQPTLEEKAALRGRIRDIAGGRCELRLHKQCLWPQILPLEGDVLWRGHLVHYRARSIGGEFTEQNCFWGCAFCHIGGSHIESKKIDVERIMKERLECG